MVNELQGIQIIVLLYLEHNGEHLKKHFGFNNC